MKSEETKEKKKNCKKCWQTKRKDGSGFQRYKNAYLSIAYHIAQMFFRINEFETHWILMIIALFDFVFSTNNLFVLYAFGMKTHSETNNLGFADTSTVH